MKKKLLFLSALLALPVAASAQIHLVAGWDFGQFTFDGYTYTDFNYEATSGHIDANYSSIGQHNPTWSHDPVTGAPVGTGTGTLSWVAQPWEDEIQHVQGFRGTRDVNTTMVDFPGSFMSNNNSDPANMALSLYQFEGHELSLTANMTGYSDYVLGDYGNAANFSFAAAANTGSPITIEWFLNGTSIGSNVIAGDHQATFSTYSLDLPESFYGGISTLTASVTGNDLVVIDNIQINGVVSAVPEPSTYAAIAGVLGLGFAAYRRRRTA